MDSIQNTPTQPVDYAALSAGYGALMGTLVLAARRRDADQTLRTEEIVPLGLATFALSKLITKEKVESWIREPFVEERPDGDRRPKGRRLRYAVGELLTCSRCAGAWSGLGLVALRVMRPREARVVNTVLGVSAANDFLQGAFTLLCARSNLEQASAQAPAPEAGDGSSATSYSASRSTGRLAAAASSRRRTGVE
ncbi:MAG TPA: DUF1360 domain-containing protein [Solirubrobacteraceae bacterium]|nr:DUF1360 domain-containing protein [Solirubrobacteraceae bacterium]